MPGDDFVDAIGQTLGSCDLMIAVIGPGWLSATDAQGRARLQDPGDFVRVEVAKALERHVRTVPVLVNRAVMPREDQLPDPLKPLIRRQAVELSDARWSSDVRELVDRVKRATTMSDTTMGAPAPAAPPHQPAAPAAAPPAAPDTGNRVRILTAVAAIVAFLGIGGAVLMKWSASSPTTTTATSPPAAPTAAPSTAPPPAATSSSPAQRADVPAAPTVSGKPRGAIDAAPVPKETSTKKEPPPKKDVATARTAAPATPAAAPSPPPRTEPPTRGAPTRATSPTPSNPTPTAAPAAPAETKPTAPPDPCEAGDADGCVNLARMYDTGRGVPRDPQRAAGLYQRGVALSQKACDENRLAACTALGVLYAGGIAVPRNDARAVALYQRACDGSDAAACHHLGQHYERGLGVAKKDANQARTLYQRACDGGAAAGCTDLGRMYERGAGVPKDPARATSLYQRGCSAGDTSACDALKWLKK